MSLGIIQYGLGPIGAGVVRYVAERKNLELVGVIDIAADKVGRDVGEMLGLPTMQGIIVTDKPDELFRQVKADCVIHTTASYLEQVFSQLEPIIKAGINIVSSTEELSFPWYHHPGLAEKIDHLAQEHGVTVLATGVNPGFLMDTWPLFMTGVCQQVEKIKAVRIQNASPRRGSFQRKIGAGHTLKEFDKLVASGALRHVGLAESIAMIASGLGWELDGIQESIEPIVTKSCVKTDFVTVEPGQASGVKQIGRGFRAGKELITLEFEASVDAVESSDAVYITGTPNTEVIIKGGTHGDIATIAMIVNSVHRVVDAPAGLVTMKDLPVVCALGVNV